MSLERSGVRVLLTPDSPMPDWITSQKGVSVGRELVKGKEFPAIEIPQGDAEFIGGGAVAISFSGQKAQRVGFNPESVLEIQSLGGELVKRNHHMCTECIANTGRMISYQAGEFAGKVNAVFQCEQNPTHQWELKNI